MINELNNTHGRRESMGGCQIYTPGIMALGAAELLH
jgi:hypothetical protein